MAMLAEPRRRKRYNLVPRGKALYEDDNRFGTKMLEKMGWKKGQGLGPKEDGSKDFVRVRYKNDALGLGFEDRNDQWTQHEQSFNGLLKALNEDVGYSNTEKDNAVESEDEIPRVGFGFQETNTKDKSNSRAEKMKQKTSGVSLEERSKQSKARVHYKKFTKGKDIVQYSEKDLANIFGKKAVNDPDALNDFFQQSSNNTYGKTEENFSVGQMINTQISVNDYFKTKMESRRNPEEEFDITANSIEKKDSNGNSSEETAKKKNKKGKKRNIEEEKEEEQECKPLIIYSNCSMNEYFKNKMDNLRNRKTKLNTREDIDNINSVGEESNEKVTKKKVKSKTDFKDRENHFLQDPAGKQSERNNHIAEQECVENKKNKNETQAIRSKRKSRKCYEGETAELLLDEESEVQVIQNENQSKKCDVEETAELLDEMKKKKDKSKNKLRTDIANESSTIKRRKCDKSQTEIAVASCLMEPSFKIDLTQEPTKKKKNKTTEITELDDSDKDLSRSYENETITNNKINKSKKSREPTESMNNEDNLTISISDKEDASSKKRPKSKRKNSRSAKNLFISDVNIQVLDLDEIRKQYKAFNIYPISSFCAEKFRNINASDFNGSILPQIEGYGLSPDLQLDVKPNKYDEERITNLWKCVLNKYVDLDKPKKTYMHYIKEFHRARKAKQKFPKLNVKTYKRKNVFQAI